MTTIKLQKAEVRTRGTWGSFEVMVKIRDCVMSQHEQEGFLVTVVPVDLERQNFISLLPVCNVMGEPKSFFQIQLLVFLSHPNIYLTLTFKVSCQSF